MAQPLDFIKTARRLVGKADSKRRRQSDLRRAISTAYYAMFHALCKNCADCLIGGTKSHRSQKAWRQAYRAVEHGFSKSQCKNSNIVSQFPKEIEDFATLYVALQEKRHSADYDPFVSFALSDVVEAIDSAEEAISELRSVPKKDLRAFAAWTAMKARKD
ncbi:hypothetical protein [Marivita hallyeonensis]|uniref:HEPN domain-containing protein n=1 Tax=Marivita hallyeonensis TaxID=996342 RepID=A0A1M5MB86_9RHOB|nr:hypothetical protein [Marivita hallyeonensis]SHG74169.1 hypothetical protein SAMN05443551_0446 [Marivita hallyeonensis]